MYIFEVESHRDKSNNYSISNVPTDSGFYNQDIYHCFEEHTETIVKVKESTLVDLIENYNIKVNNTQIKNGRIQAGEWPHRIVPNSNCLMNESPNCILLGNIDEKKFKLLNSFGNILYMTDKDLKKKIQSGKVLNCSCVGEKEKIYKSMDTYNTQTNPELIDYIAKKYAEFRAKSVILGLDISFEYIIEGEDIKIKRYTGTSSKVALPSFVTTICANAFRHSKIQELKLNLGLKRIGHGAFADNNIQCVELPETVEFVILDRRHYNADKNTYKKLNTNTELIYI